MPTATLPHDPLWPRTGNWPAAGDTPADLVLVGLPTHKTSLSPTRADRTPAAIRAVLPRYAGHARTDDGRLLDLDALLRIVDAGDIAAPDAEEIAATTHIRALAARHGFVLALGGDNAATVPAALGAWGADIDHAGLITLDAHYDLRDGRSNGSPVRRLIEAGLDPRRIVQIGIADFANSTAYARRADALGITVIPRQALEDAPLSDIVARALDTAGSGGGPVHADIDVDVCDRAVAPACPASVPGGISAARLRRTVRLLARDPRLGSLDITEIDAAADSADGRTVRLGAQLVLETIAGYAERTGGEVPTGPFLAARGGS